jgi:hypothetical protein
MADHGAISASERIVYIDRSEIREGSIEELKAGVQRLVEFIHAREPQLISYGFYIVVASRFTARFAVPAPLEGRWLAVFVFASQPSQLKSRVDPEL